MSAMFYQCQYGSIAITLLDAIVNITESRRYTKHGPR